jgi:glycerophosphoryl diester phosphodiesterase
MLPREERAVRVLLGALAAILLSASPALADPIVIGHRGASGYRPEHTLAAYELAIQQGADFIEPDLVSTKDGVLIARHEHELSGTTDVAAKFPGRRTTKTIDGKPVVGWFSEDFTIAEIRTLRARERVEARSHAHDGQFEIPTLREVIELARRRSRETGRTIGLYPETKHPSYFASIGLPLEERLLRELASAGWTDERAPVFIQSFETSNLKALARRTRIRLVQLLSSGYDRPADLAASGDTRRFVDLMAPEGLREIATYASGIGPAKTSIVPVNPDGSLQPPTSLVADAHEAGLLVHPYTFRADSLPAAYGGDAAAEIRQFLALGIDGFFTDFPDVGVRARR